VSTSPSVSPAPVQSPALAGLTVLAGLRAEATAAVAGGMLAADPSLVLVRHDTSEVRGGAVRRIVRTRAEVLEDEQVPLAHGCLSCTLREDIVPTLARLARADPHRDLVLVLPEVVEPAAVAGACAYCLVDGEPLTRWLRFDSYLTVVDSATFLDDLTSIDALADRGMQAAEADERCVAEVLARQLEFADTLLLWEDVDQEPYERERCRLLLHRLVPWATHLTADPAVDPAADPAAGLLPPARIPSRRRNRRSSRRRSRRRCCRGRPCPRRPRRTAPLLRPPPRARRLLLRVRLRQAFP
jgi:hypothetical protein